MMLTGPGDTPDFLIVQEKIDTEHELISTLNYALGLVEEQGLSVYDYFDIHDLEEDTQAIFQQSQLRRP
ncbi:hypothetical protein [Vibrio thalassae]|nr:hypothetical protein [Vibrio thalassae]